MRGSRRDPRLLSYDRVKKPLGGRLSSVRLPRRQEVGGSGKGRPLPLSPASAVGWGDSVRRGSGGFVRLICRHPRPSRWMFVHHSPVADRPAVRPFFAV